MNGGMPTRYSFDRAPWKRGRRVLFYDRNFPFSPDSARVRRLHSSGKHDSMSKNIIFVQSFPRKFDGFFF